MSPPLFPLSRNPVPPATILLPTALDPVQPRVRRSLPAAWCPDVSVTIPAPVATLPGKVSPRARRYHFSSHRRWGPPDVDRGGGAFVARRRCPVWRTRHHQQQHQGTSSLHPHDFAPAKSIDALPAPTSQVAPRPPYRPLPTHRLFPSLAAPYRPYRPLPPLPIQPSVRGIYSPHVYHRYVRPE